MPTNYGAVLGIDLADGYQVPGNATVYCAPFRNHSGGAFSTTEMDVRYRLLRGGILRNLFFELRDAQPNDGDLIVTVRWEFGDSALTVTVPAGELNNSTGVAWSDAAHDVSVGLGDTLTISIENQSSSPSAKFNYITLGFDYI